MDDFVQVVPECPVYLYLFTYGGPLGLGKQLLTKDDHLTVDGTAHGDEIGYLFKIKFIPEPLKTSPEFSVVSRMVDMWTNFATNG